MSFLGFRCPLKITDNPKGHKISMMAPSSQETQLGHVNNEIGMSNNFMKQSWSESKSWLSLSFVTMFDQF
jgi:hypothetical protein